MSLNNVLYVHILFSRGRTLYFNFVALPLNKEENIQFKMSICPFDI